MIKGNTLILSGFLVVLLGISLIIIGTIIQSGSGNNSRENDSSAEIKTGGVILIGPIPIIFGSDKRMAITGVVMALILMVAYYYLFYRK
ncbi:TIGR00304 family protein [Methanobacterium alkalithermotolerans]|uniref:TIGR00304 family protein n=1 Tax=Methanobacterium alkalithermotolerans TaxID=2731220 RepID=A0A8T8K7L9_9EURY|nr:TIGR00304 family protein [Methanobacterium alkalithermotolerans]QUH24017.1 TIGR00304 family protein [Methanobacterium alkalithermotolerans]